MSPPFGCGRVHTVGELRHQFQPPLLLPRRERRLAARIGGAPRRVFAVLALTLAAVGIYGVVSYSVTQATHDIGVRMALGANAGAVLKMVFSGAIRLALLEIVIGAPGGFAATRALRKLLFGSVPAIP